MKTLILIGLVMAILPSHAEIVTKTIEYKHGDTVLEGVVAYDNSNTAKRPGIIVVHEWMGLNDYAIMRARMLAELGYVAFAADVYGKGVRPQNREEAGQQAGKYRSDRQLLRGRLQAALKTFQNNDLVDKQKIAVMGYCFGGGAALELARSGADVVGAVSFHGNLDTPNPADAMNIKGRILVLHGADDPHVSMEQVTNFQQEMRDANVDWQFNSYGDAVHAFTNKAAGNDKSKGGAYNEKADKRSWEAMKLFFKEVFGEMR